MAASKGIAAYHRQKSMPAKAWKREHLVPGCGGDDVVELKAFAVEECGEFGDRGVAPTAGTLFQLPGKSRTSLSWVCGSMGGNVQLDKTCLFSFAITFLLGSKGWHAGKMAGCLPGVRRGKVVYRYEHR
jgi:hypothetical protein